MTSEIVDGVPELGRSRVGLATIFMQHTSASLTLNENASPDVRRDFSAWFDDAVPDGGRLLAHARGSRRHARTHQGVPTGASLVIPVAHGRLALGTWQGIYLCEHRDHGGARSVVVTAFGDEA